MLGQPRLAFCSLYSLHPHWCSFPKTETPSEQTSNEARGMKSDHLTYIFHDTLGRADHLSILQLMLRKVDLWNDEVCTVRYSGDGIGGMGVRGRHGG